MFPERREEELIALVEKAADMNETIDSPPRAKIKKVEDVNSSKFESLRSLRELLEGFQKALHQTPML